MVPKASRLGVGATASSSTKDQPAETSDWTKSGKKQILSVGRKRHHQDDDDDDVHISNDGLDGNNSSSDEEEGRTSAVKEKKRNIRPVVPAVPAVARDVSTSTVVASDDVATTKKKKKKGKKERSLDVTDARTTTTTNTAPDATTYNDPNDSKNNKPQRKKIRSRQKNIRKDTRATEEKPTHLVHGNVGYAGRPLTKATRDKLGLKSSEGITKGGASRRNKSGGLMGHSTRESGLAVVRMAILFKGVTIVPGILELRMTWGKMLLSNPNNLTLERHYQESGIVLLTTHHMRKFTNQSTKATRTRRRGRPQRRSSRILLLGNAHEGSETIIVIFKLRLR